MNYIGEDDKMSRNNVNYINYKEECLLDERHRQEYLKRLRAYLRSRKLTNTTACSKANKDNGWKCKNCM